LYSDVLTICIVSHQKRWARFGSVREPNRIELKWTEPNLNKLKRTEPNRNETKRTEPIGSLVSQMDQFRILLRYVKQEKWIKNVWTVRVKYSYIFLSFLDEQTQAINKLRTFYKEKSICIEINLWPFQELERFVWVKIRRNHFRSRRK